MKGTWQLSMQYCNITNVQSWNRNAEKWKEAVYFFWRNKVIEENGAESITLQYNALTTLNAAY